MPACTTPLLRPVWCSAMSLSFSSTMTSPSGRSSAIRLATARPMMPAPTIPIRMPSVEPEDLFERRGPFGRNALLEQVGHRVLPARVYLLLRHVRARRLEIVRLEVAEHLVAVPEDRVVADARHAERIEHLGPDVPVRLDVLVDLVRADLQNEGAALGHSVLLARDQDDQCARAVYALDATELDVRRGRGTRDERDRAARIDAVEGLGQELADLRLDDDADMEIRHERHPTAALLRAGREDDRAALGDRGAAAGQRAVDLVELPRGEVVVLDELDTVRSPRQRRRDGESPDAVRRAHL